MPINNLTIIRTAILFLLALAACGTPVQKESEDTSDPDISSTDQISNGHVPERDLLPPGWIDISAYKAGILSDIRYATRNNFVGEELYECGKCYLREEAAEALLKVHMKLQNKEWSIKVFDCYRPLSIQQKLWDKVPDPRYVTSPEKGSMHNRGLAVDLTIVDASGTDLDMGTEYDFFGPQAYHSYKDLPLHVLENRDLLRSIMNQFGFRHIQTEWWHYSLSNASGEISDWIWECR